MTGPNETPSQREESGKDTEMKWDYLTQYQQNKYINKALYLIDNGYVSDMTDVYEIAKGIYYTEINNNVQ